MALVDDFKGSDIARIGEGSYPARIAQMLDLGKQEDEYKGETSVRDKLWITFELPTETITIDGKEKPRWLSREFTKSFNERSLLTKVLNAAFDADEIPNVQSFKEFLGREMLIEVGTTSGGKDKWIGAMKLPKGMSVAPLQNKGVYFDMDCPDMELLNSLPDFLQDKITSSESYKGGTPF